MAGTEASCLLLLLLTLLSPLAALPTSGLGRPVRTTTIDYDLADLDEYVADPGVMDTINYGDPAAYGPGNDPGNDYGDSYMGASDIAGGYEGMPLGAAGLGSYDGFGLEAGLGNGVGLSSDYPYIDTMEPLSDEDLDHTESLPRVTSGSTAQAMLEVFTTDKPDYLDALVTSKTAYSSGIPTHDIGHEQTTGRPENGIRDQRNGGEPSRPKGEDRNQIRNSQRNALLAKYKSPQDDQSGTRNVPTSIDGDVDYDADMDRSASKWTPFSHETSKASKSGYSHASKYSNGTASNDQSKTTTSFDMDRSSKADDRNSAEQSSNSGDNPFTTSDTSEKNSQTLSSIDTADNNSRNSANASKSITASSAISTNTNDPISYRNESNEAKTSAVQNTEGNKPVIPVTEQSIEQTHSLHTIHNDKSAITNNTSYSAKFETSRPQGGDTTDLDTCFADNLSQDSICYLARSLHAICTFQYPSECNQSMLDQMKSNAQQAADGGNGRSLTEDRSRTRDTTETLASLTAETMESISASFRGSAGLNEIMNMIKAICPELCKLASSSLPGSQNPDVVVGKSGSTGDLSKGTDNVKTRVKSIDDDQDDASLDDANDSDDLDTATPQVRSSAGTQVTERGTMKDDISQDSSENSHDSDARLSITGNGSSYGDYRLGIGSRNDVIFGSFNSATANESRGKQTKVTENSVDARMERSRASNGSD